MGFQGGSGFNNTGGGDLDSTKINNIAKADQFTWIQDAVSGYWYKTSATKWTAQNAALFDAYSSLLGYWDCSDNAANTDVLDKLETYDGALGGGDNTTDISVAAKYGNGLDLDGTNDYVAMGDVLDFERTDPFSLAIWVKRGSTDDGMLLTKTESAGVYRGYYLSFGTNKLLFVLRNTLGSNELDVRTTNTFASTADWYHIVATYDGSSKAAGVRFYVNGAAEAKDAPGEDTLTATTLNAAPFNIGRRNSASVSFNGIVNIAQVYGRVLLPAEVTALYNTTTGAFLV